MLLDRRRLAYAVAVVLAGGVAAFAIVELLPGAASTAPWTVASSPYALSFAGDSGKRVGEAVSPAAGPGGRLTYALADGSFHQVTRLERRTMTATGETDVVATDEPGRTAVVNVARSPNGEHVSWRLRPASGVKAVFEAFTTSTNEHFLGIGGSSAYVDLTGQLIPLRVTYACGRSITVPFYVSSTGYGIRFETDAVGQIEFAGPHDGFACSAETNPGCSVGDAPTRVQVCFAGSSLSYEVYRGAPMAIVAAFRRTAGLAPLPAPDELGLIKWRDRVAGAADLLADVSELHRLHVPIRSVLLDNPWEQDDCLGPLTFDRKRFPDPAALIRAIHAAGVKVMVWVSPYVTATDTCRALAGYAPHQTIATEDDDHTPVDVVDLTDARARAAFAAKIAALVRLGVDGFKGDRGDEVDLTRLTLAAGNPLAVQNTYPALFAAAVESGARDGGARSPTTMFRAATTGTPPTGVGVWAGDQTPDFAGMRAAIRQLGSLGASGFALTGSDIGGYGAGTYRPITPAAFVRWGQLGVVSPIFEVGGANLAARFWQLGPEAVRLFRASAVLHYELFPYLYGLLRTSSLTGSPVLRPLGLQWPDDREAWSHDLELTAGSDLLAAPVTSRGTNPSVYLPHGSWADLFAGTVVPGGRETRRPTPLSEFPLYLRAGAAIPFDVRSPQLWSRAWPTDALTMAGRAGWLYAPGPGTEHASAAGAGTFTATGSGSDFTAKLAGAAGETEVLVATGKSPRSVSIGGATVTGSRSSDDLRGRSTGWLRVTRPFPGILVKLAPKNGAASFSVGL